MNLHGQIMNLPLEHEGRAIPEEVVTDSGGIHIAYKLGHRDARHQAAELSIQADAVMDRMSDAIEGLLDWCAEIAGDNVDEEAAEHEENTVAYARSVLKEYKQLKGES